MMGLFYHLIINFYKSKNKKIKTLWQISFITTWKNGRRKREETLFNNLVFLFFLSIKKRPIEPKILQILGLDKTQIENIEIANLSGSVIQSYEFTSTKDPVYHFVIKHAASEIGSNRFITKWKSKKRNGTSSY